MQILVVGAGVIGLAVARAAALAGHEVIVAEQAAGIGHGVSSRNSEVIHAGIYYPSGSLRAYHCPRGRRMLYDYCASHGVPHRKCGKLVVATNDVEATKLEALLAQALANGCENMGLIEPGEAQRMEPTLACIGALNSPETGIIDSQFFMRALQGDLEDRGGMIAFNTRIEGLARSPDGWQVRFDAPEPEVILVDAAINCAGLSAQALARVTEGYPSERVPKLVLAKGNYFGFAGRPAFSRLIYPAPVPGGLGVHVTLDLAGRMRFGPDVEWIEAENYDVDPTRADAFYRRIRDYWPALPDGSLVPDYAGIRPKLTGPGEPAADFLLDAPADHGLPRLVHLFGIESPGLTSSLSLAEAVIAAIEE
jgi:L-2-hydroxyglutarate oxidase LhgO